MNTQIIRLSQPRKVSMANDWFEVNKLNHFWLRHRQKLIIQHFKREIMDADNLADVGCGDCSVLNGLSEKCNKIIDGIDLNETVLEKSHSTKGRVFLYDILERNTQMKSNYDFILMLDVLEHIEDELPFLEAVKWHLKPNGKLLLNVPCHPSLYSLYDKMDGHYRRYTIKHLRSSLTKAGFSVNKVVNWGYIYLPLISLRKQVLRFMSMEKAVKTGFKTNKMSNLFFSALRFLDFNTKWVWPGASTLVLVEKVG